VRIEVLRFWAGLTRWSKCKRHGRDNVGKAERIEDDKLIKPSASYIAKQAHVVTRVTDPRVAISILPC
jgi:hypothetical protein